MTVASGAVTVASVASGAVTVASVAFRAATVASVARAVTISVTVADDVLAVSIARIFVAVRPRRPRVMTIVLPRLRALGVMLL